MRARRSYEGQFDLFPERIIVEELDAKAVAGASTRVEALYRVRYEREGAFHQVFFDQYGWYCAEHGPTCKAVREATARRARGDAPASSPASGPVADA